MKHLTKNPDQHFMAVYLLFCLAGFCGFFIPTPAICDNSVADEIISLSVTNRPLGEVLENISIAADCQFSIDERWEDYPITASFDNESLYRALKIIFRNINNAVVYGADRTIKIIIYDESTPSGKAIGHSVIIKSSPKTIQPPRPSDEATAPQPEVEESEDSSDAENVEQEPQETTESAPEMNEADAENPSAEETAPDEGDEETSADAAAEPNENTPAGSDIQSEETESASDSSENAESN